MVGAHSKTERFLFSGLHDHVRIGTASDRYTGWLGQIYTEGRYEISSRNSTVGGKTFKEEMLPVESVKKYFEHFPLLGLDFTFYRPLLDAELRATPNYHVLESYRRHLTEDDRIILNAPQVVFAQRLRRGGEFLANRDYLNAELFARQFYAPDNQIMGEIIDGFIFEQEYQPKKNRVSPKEYVEKLDGFLILI